MWMLLEVIDAIQSKNNLYGKVKKFCIEINFFLFKK
jgi:hypothetical protein